MRLPTLFLLFYKLQSKRPKFMKKKTKIIFTLTIILIIFVLGVTNVIAQDPEPKGLNLTGKLTNVGTAAGFKSETPELAITLGLIIRGFLTLLGVIFMAYIIYGGYQWMTARGNEEQLTKAKAVIRGSIIGLIIALAAYAITAYVMYRVAGATGYRTDFEKALGDFPY